MNIYRTAEIPPHLRKFFRPAEIGLEPTPEEYVIAIVGVFREVRRVLRSDGTLWLNLGDSYATGADSARELHRIRDDKRGYRGDRLANGRGDNPAVLRKKTRDLRDGSHCGKHTAMAAAGAMSQPNRLPIPGLKPKDMVGIPWRVAFALQADGWYLRCDIVWSKPNPMPEAVKDRPTKAHEYLFLLSKSATYYYDTDAIKEPVTGGAHARGNGVNPKALGGDQPRNVDSRYRAPGQAKHTGLRKRGLAAKNERSGDPRKEGFNERWRVKQNASFSGAVNELVDHRNKRSVWTIPTEPVSDAHFATFPRKLVEPCILAGCPRGGVTLDPFGGSGTVGRVAEDLGRKWLLFDLNPAYAEIAKKRTAQTGLLGRMEADVA